MSLFDDLAPTMDDRVDELLGDLIEYKRPGGDWTPVPGFVLDINALLGSESLNDIGAIDELMQRKRIKIQIAKIARPDPADRIRAPKLGEGTFKPVGKFDVAGRYWVSDVQKVNA